MRSLRWPFLRSASSGRFDAADWERRLDSQLPLFSRLPAAARAAVLERMQRLLSRVPFVGCNGLEVVDEMRALIGGQASILIHGLPPEVLDSLYGIMLYPDEFVVEEVDEDEQTGVVTEGRRALSGQTLDTDRIVLSWQDVLDGRERRDGYNVVVHEFAHYLDHASHGRFSEREPALQRGYAALLEAIERGEETLIDPYGAEEPAEFFAVLAEAFIELPLELRARHPEAYAALRRALNLDPALWYGG